MQYSWQGSDSKKLSLLKQLYNTEIEENQEVKLFSIEEKPIVHICNSLPSENATLWYIQNNQTNSLTDLINFYSDLKEKYNIKNILIKDASYSTIYGYVHILLNQFNKVIYLRNEHEIDSYMIYLLVEEKIDASS